MRVLWIILAVERDHIPELALWLGSGKAVFTPSVSTQGWREKLGGAGGGGRK